MPHRPLRLSTQPPDNFNGLITDIRLGAGKTGWDIARHLRNAKPVILVVYMNGDSAIHWSADGVPESIMIQKPFFLAQIITAISTLLNQPRRPRHRNRHLFLN